MPHKVAQITYVPKYDFNSVRNKSFEIGTILL